jgi:hypothetical protein
MWGLSLGGFSAPESVHGVHGAQTNAQEQYETRRTITRPTKEV